MVSLAAFATYSDGTQNQISGSSVGWSSSATNIATVTSPGGSVTGVAIGTATITASSQGISGTATVNVTLSNITSLVITTTQGSTQNQTMATINGVPGTLQFFAYANGSASERRDAIGNLDFVEHERGNHQQRRHQWQWLGDQL